MQQATKSVISSQYTMDGEPVCLTDTCVYLGVTMNSKLRWNALPVELVEATSLEAFKLRLHVLQSLQ